MRNRLPSVLPLAVAASTFFLAAAAAAQSTVVIYGALDAYVARQTASGSASRSVVNSGFNPNSLGFRGTEDLGGGLKAGFVLEGQPQLDTGTYGQGGKPFGRQSLIFLAGDWGQIAAGRIHTAGRSFGIKYSATGWLATEPSGNLEVAMGSGIAPVMNGDTVGSRISNSVMYTSPLVGGFQGSLLQSAAEGGTFATGSAKVTIAGLTYTNGPFTADVVYNRIPEIAGSQLKQTDFAFGAQYNFGPATLMGALQTKRAAAVGAPGATTAITGSEATDRLYLLGVRVPLGASTIGVTVGRVNIAAAHRGRRPTNVTAPFSTIQDDMSAASIAYTYALSKRTQLFAAYGRLANSGVANGSITVDLRPTAGGTSSMLATGVRLSF